jgi:hypothetical protein
MRNVANRFRTRSAPISFGYQMDPDPGAVTRVNVGARQGDAAWASKLPSKFSRFSGVFESVEQGDEWVPRYGFRVIFLGPGDLTRCPATLTTKRPAHV